MLALSQVSGHLAISMVTAVLSSWGSTGSVPVGNRKHSSYMSKHNTF